MALTQTFSISFRRPRLVLHGLLSLLGALTLVGSVACGSASSPPAPGSPTASPPSPTESLQSDDFGPLAVVDSLGGSLALGGTGPIHIEENCVRMTRGNGEMLLLIWHANEVRWDEENREIIYSSAADPDAQPVAIRVRIGGIGDPVAIQIRGLGDQRLRIQWRSYAVVVRVEIEGIWRAVAVGIEAKLLDGPVTVNIVRPSEPGYRARLEFEGEVTAESIGAAFDMQSKMH